MKGGQSQRCEVRGAGGANGVECGECAPSPEIFKKFFWFNVFKKFLCSGRRGGIGCCDCEIVVCMTSELAAATERNLIRRQFDYLLLDLPPTKPDNASKHSL